VGASVVNALSEWLEVANHRGGKKAPGYVHRHYLYQGSSPPRIRDSR
jgi:DNA gyrase/topoisomerase IV subunit B